MSLSKSRAVRAVGALVTVVVAVSVTTLTPVFASTPTSSGTGSTGLCGTALNGHRTCMVRAQTQNGQRLGQRSALSAAQGTALPSSGYSPSDIQRAYNLGASGGSTQTVAIVDAYDNPNVAADLTAYRTYWNLPACTLATGCFRKVDEFGGGSFVPASTNNTSDPSYGWGSEIDLDVEAVSAACPNCHILLVEGQTSSDYDFMTGIATAARLGATEISLSIGGCEGSPDQPQFDAALSRTNLPVAVSSGDSGYLSADNPAQQNPGTACTSGNAVLAGAPSYPASSPYVTAVGGTSLARASGTSRGFAETAWSYDSSYHWGGGSGCSSDEPKPAWQHDAGCSHRMVADVSAVADPRTGLAIFDSYDDNGWDVFGGTSLSAPLVAGIYGLGGGSATPQSWYASGASVYDVTSGTNAPLASDCTPAYVCNAGPGYDGPTGNGTPNGRPGQVAVAPSAPTSVTATAGNGAAQLSWDAPITTGSAPITSYTVKVFDKTSALVGTQTFGPSPTALVTRLTNGTPYFFAVSASNGVSSPWSAPSYSVTPASATPPAVAVNNTTASTAQYMLPNSDGATWQQLDPARLALSIAPSATGSYLVTANADLWTSTAGYNQDMGICLVSGTASCDAAHVVTWKESGGFAGTFSPNAAYAQASVTLSAGTPYTASVVWKTNKPALGATIFAAAGSSPTFSPSRLSIRALPAASVSASNRTQFGLSNSDGASWTDIDANGSLTLTIPAQGSSGTALIGGNADLWTSTIGINQDIGIEVTAAGTSYNHTIVAWKESGGFAGTFSPNAAFVETSIPIQPGVAYTVTLQWKSNLSAPGATIWAGAGSIGNFSPTTLVAQVVPSAFVTTSASSPASQYPLANSDGATWSPVDDSTFQTTLTVPTGTTCLASIGANADLWTDHATFNQDLAILVNGSPVAWKESGGFAGTFSPNAAFVETEQTVRSGDTVTIRWKTNVPSRTNIYAGAGRVGSFSPSTLLVQYLSCS